MGVSMICSWVWNCSLCAISEWLACSQPEFHNRAEAALSRLICGAFSIHGGDQIPIEP